MRRALDVVAAAGRAVRQHRGVSAVIAALGLVLWLPIASAGSAAAATGPVQTILPFTGLNEPFGVAVDAAGDIYVSDFAQGDVIELPAGSTAQQVLPFTGLPNPAEVAVDSSGDVYVGSYGLSEILELPAGSTTQQVLPFTGSGYGYGVTVDRNGDVYATSNVSDAGSSVTELAAGSTTKQVLPFTGLIDPDVVAVDAAGDVFVLDEETNDIFELPAGSATQRLLPFTGLIAPVGMAVDSAGDVFVTDQGTDSVLELPAAATSPSQQITLPFTGLTSPVGIAVNPAGDVYVTDWSNGHVDELSSYVATATAVTSVSPATPVSGQPLTVNVSVTPATGALAPGGQVTVTDGGTGSCTASLTPGTGSAAGTGVGSCQLTETAGGPYTLTASYNGAGAYAASAGTGTVTVDSAPAFVTSTPPATATAGQSYGYTFTASGSPALAYALSGAPSWLTIDSATGALSGTVPAGTTSFSYMVTAANAVGTATAGPFTVTVSKAVPPRADLSAQLTCPRTLTTGSTATCILVVSNAGPDSASQVTAALALPSSLAQIACSSGCTLHGNILTWTLPSLAAGGRVTDTATVRAARTGAGLLLAAAVSHTADPRPLNNVAAALITIIR
jgi:hypothetical protein